MDQPRSGPDGPPVAAAVERIARDLIAAAIRGDRTLGRETAARAGAPSVAAAVTQLLDDVVTAALQEWAGREPLAMPDVDDGMARITFLSSSGRWYPGVEPEPSIYRDRLEAHNRGVRDLAGVTGLPAGITGAGALSVMAAAVLTDERGAGVWQDTDDWEERLDHVEGVVI